MVLQIKFDEIYPKDRDLEEFKSIFCLAEIDVKEWIAIPNKYWPETPEYYNNASHWYLADTKYGFIQIGWRKRVISIDWSRTSVRHIVTEDEVTKSVTYVHAWKNIKAIEYLKEFKRKAGENI